MKLTPWQSEVAKSQKRFKTVIAGRRAGKSFLAIRELCYHARLPRQRVWYVAPTRSQAKGLVWDKLKDRLGSLNWLAKVNESDLALTLVNGSVIELRSGDSYDRMRGYAVNYIVFDEFADIDKEAWFSVARACLSDTMGKAMFISTPKGLGNWAFDIYNQGLTQEDWASWQITTEAGGQVSEEELESARQDLDERTYLQEYCASFVQYSGVIYYNFDRKQNCEAHSGDIPDQLHIGTDFNVDPMASTVGYRRPDGVFHVIDYLNIYGSNTHELCDEIKRRYPRSRITVYPDAAGSQRKTSANGMTDIIILQNAGFTVRVPNRNPPVKDRIASVNSRLCSSTGVVGLKIDPKCKPVIEALERQTYKEGTQIPAHDGFEHQNDSLGYVIHSLYPIKRDRLDEPPGKWRGRQGSRL